MAAAAGGSSAHPHVPVPAPTTTRLRLLLLLAILPLQQQRPWLAGAAAPQLPRSPPPGLARRGLAATDAAAGCAPAAATPLPGPAPFSRAALLRSLDLALGQEHGPRIYIYPPFDGLHPWANVSRADCLAHQDSYWLFGTPLWEQVLVQQLERDANVVADPAQAELLIIGHNAMCYMSMCTHENHGDWEGAFQAVFTQYLQPYLEQVRAGAPWRASRGANHVVGFAMDHGACSWPRQLLQLVEHAIILQPNGYGVFSGAQGVLPNWRKCYNASRAVVLPPYIIPEKDQGKAPQPAHIVPLRARPILANFRGAARLDNIYHSQGIRQLLLLTYKALKRSDPLFARVSFNANHSTTSGKSVYIQEASQSVFSLCPGGWSPWTPRPYSVMTHGSLPVIMADGFVAPFEGLLPWRKFAHKLLGGATVDTFSVLRDDELYYMPELEARQALMLHLRPHLMWTPHGARHGAAAMAVLELACRFVWPQRAAGPPPGAYCGHGEPPIALDGWTASDVKLQPCDLKEQGCD